MNQNAEAIVILCSRLCVGEGIRPLEAREWSKLAQQLLERHPDMNGLFFAAAGVHGGCRAVEESGRRPKIITFDEVPTTLEMLKKVVISATISQQPYRQGAESLDLLFEYLTSGAVPGKERFFVDHSIIIRENMP